MELGQRLMLVWTLFLSFAVVSTNGDILVSPGNVRKGLGHHQVPPGASTNIEDLTSPQSHKPNNIIVQPGYGTNSKVKNGQNDASTASRPGKDEAPKSKTAQSNSPNSILPSTKSAKAPNGKIENPRVENPASSLPVKPATEQKPRSISPQSNPPSKIIVQPGYEKPDPKLGSPRSSPSSNPGSPPGPNFPVQPSNQQTNNAENPQSDPMSKIQPRYGFHVARAAASAPSNVPLHPGFDQRFQLAHRQVNPSYSVPVQSSWEQSSYIANPRSNIPLRTFVVQPTYEQNDWVEIPPQLNVPKTLEIEPVYIQSSNNGNLELEPSGNSVVQPSAGQGYWVRVPQSNSVDVQFQPVVATSSRFNQPGYGPTNTMEIPPGYGAASWVGIAQLNPTLNRGVQPAYQRSSNAVDSEVEPLQNIEIQPAYAPQSAWAGIPEPHPLRSPPIQSDHEVNRQAMNPRTNPPTNGPAQLASEQRPQATNPAGYPTINVSFFRGYERPSLRAEHPQPIPSEVPAQPATNTAVEPSSEKLDPTGKTSWTNVPNDIPAQPRSGESIIRTQNAPSTLPSFAVEAAYERPSPQVGCSQSHVPKGLPAGYHQNPAASSQQTQATKTIALPPGLPKPILKVIAPQTTASKEVLVQPGYGQLHCHLKFIPQGNYALNLPGDSSLEADIQRNQDLQRLVLNQLHSMQDQTRVPNPQEAHFGPLPFFVPQTPAQSMGPFGGKSFKKKKHGREGVPLLFRSATKPQCTERHHYPRSLDNESGPTGGHAKPVVWNYPQASPIGPENITEVVNSFIPKVNSTVNSYVNSTLGKIRSQFEQRNDTNVSTGITSRIVDAAKNLEKKVSDVISPILGSQGNGNPLKNPGNLHSPQASVPNIFQNGYQPPYDLQRLANHQGFSQIPMMLNNLNGVPNFVNEYGRSVMGVLPSTFNTAVDNSNAYLKGFYDNLKGYVQ